jgi:ubiquinone/menaquinone biosynthesis C-methylase UbiE
MNNFSDTLIEEYDLFGKVFPFHDELQNCIPGSLEKHFLDKTKNYTFLDIGAGYGFTTSCVAKIFPNAHFIVNEYDSELLSRADKYLSAISRENKLGDIELVIKDIPDASVDAAYTAWVLHNFPKEKRKVIFKEISRILKPDGIFVYLEKIGNPGKERTESLVRFILSIDGFLNKYYRPDLFIDWVKHYLRDEEPELLFSDDEHETLLKENNFSTECIKNILLEKVFVTKNN